jgi:hypothetical protein
MMLSTGMVILIGVTGMLVVIFIVFTAEVRRAGREPKNINHHLRQSHSIDTVDAGSS